MPDGAVVVLGASPKEDRYSNKAVRLLMENGYDPVPVHPLAQTIHGQPCRTSLAEVKGPVDTITVYLGAKNSDPLIDDILAAAPRRLILNPGAENPALEERARAAGIEVLHACTLVLLSTNQFDQ